MARRLIGHREAAAFVGMSVRKVSSFVNAALVRSDGTALRLVRCRCELGKEYSSTSSFLVGNGADLPAWRYLIVRELNVDRPIRLDVVTVHDQLLRMRDSDGALYGWHLKVNIFLHCGLYTKMLPALHFANIGLFSVFATNFCRRAGERHKSNHRHERVTW
jgi:hypothetical protein